MPAEVLLVTIKGIMPTANGCAVFLGDEDKTFVIYVDQFVGHALQMTLKGVKRERPLTHDLIESILLGLEARLDRVVINDVKDRTFFARIFLHMENELGRKLVEIDARPSDSMVLAMQLSRPIFVARHVYESVEDMSRYLSQALEQQQKEEEEGETEESEGEGEGGDEGEFPPKE